MTSRSKRKEVKHNDLVRTVVRKMVSVPIEKLGLSVSVPKYFKRKEWPDGDRVNGICRGHAFVGAVLSCYASGAIEQVMQVPAFLKEHPTWGALCAESGDVLPVYMIVEGLSSDLLVVGSPDRLDTLLGIEAKRVVLQ